MFSGVIYFIQAGVGGPVKIGTTSKARIKKRLYEIQNGNHEKCKIISLHIGGDQTEKMLHRKFSDSLIRGEWFSPSKDILNLAKGKVEWVRCLNEIESEAILAKAFKAIEAAKADEIIPTGGHTDRPAQEMDAV